MSRIMALVYDRFMGSMERACGHAWRRELLGELRGDVLEVGAGTGRNLDHYRGIDRLVLAEPEPNMRRRLLAKQAQVAGAEGASVAKGVEVVPWSAERLACEAETFDAVVCTLVLCSVEDPRACLEEIRRVLRPGGKLVFLEHVASDDAARRRWQQRAEPLWKRVAGNCHLCRDTAQTIESAGFVLERLTRESARKTLALVRPMIRGVARAPLTP